jgi:DNA-binding NtrC family response regulator
MGKAARKPLLLIVDDEANFRESLQMVLEDGYAVSLAGSLAQAREELRARVPDAILLDIRLPDGEGMELLHELEGFRRMPVVIVMTAHATVGSAVRALREGAADYVVKPFDIAKLRRELAVYLENCSLHQRIDILNRELKRIAPPFLTSGTGGMKDIVDKVPQIAPLDIPILISGETGTGKERLANWIHALSGRGGEMVAINCAALPRDLLESELFGYARGAFSGAATTKEGLVERADGGTLFLDEIGELPEGVQAKFLRVLEDGAYYKLGETRERRVSFRLISATNHDLADPAGGFRRDLFYRVSGIAFHLPPLRERQDDIPLLIPAFIKEANHAYKKVVKGVSLLAMKQLVAHAWPGNIRELKWCINRGVAVATGETLDLADLSLSRPAVLETPLSAGDSVDYGVPFEEAVEQLEKRYLSHALRVAGDNKTEAARLLGISVRMLHYKIKKYAL